MFVGNKQARARLSFLTGNPANSVLIFGPDGVGKFSSAIWYARHLICGAAHDTCNSCDRIERRIHPDLMVLEQDGLSIGVDAVREALLWAQASPLEGAYRMIVVREANKLTPQAANALLKMTEEPPATTRFVMTTSQSILPTLASRSTEIDFVSIPQDEIVEALGGGDKAVQAAHHAGGSYSTAKAILDSGMLDRRTEIVKFLRGSPAHHAFRILKADDDIEAWRKLFAVITREELQRAHGSPQAKRLADLWTRYRRFERTAGLLTTTARFHLCTALAEWAS